MQKLKRKKITSTVPKTVNFHMVCIKTAEFRLLRLQAKRNR